MTLLSRHNSDAFVDATAEECETGIQLKESTTKSSEGRICLVRAPEGVRPEP